MEKPKIIEYRTCQGFQRFLRLLDGTLLPIQELPFLEAFARTASTRNPGTADSGDAARKKTAFASDSHERVSSSRERALEGVDCADTSGVVGDIAGDGIQGGGSTAAANPGGSGGVSAKKEAVVTRRQRIEWLMWRILAEKEKIDCEHVRRAAPLGCSCRRCLTARAVRSKRRIEPLGNEVLEAKCE